MLLKERLQAFATLGERLASWKGTEAYETLKVQAKSKNNWFTPENTDLALDGLMVLLEPATLEKWTQAYELEPVTPQTVGIVMAGNIPFVGFHDFLCVLLAGHRAAIKLSSQDQILMGAIIRELLVIAPQFESRILIKEHLKDIDAVIATGSDNSSRYFEYYFSKIPHIIRKNRTSVAVIDGTESVAELDRLWTDVYQYFGLGCRNVSKLFIPKGYDLTQVLQRWEQKGDLAHHNKYFNNYEYNKSIYLINKNPHLDTGYGLWMEEAEALVSPISVTFYQTYASTEDLTETLRKNETKIQCVVAKSLPGSIPFGQAQYPTVSDYADGVDTLAFLQGL